MAPPPPPESPANPFLTHAGAHAHPAESSASAVRYAPPARRTKSESPKASECARTHPAPWGFPRRGAHNRESLPTQFHGRFQICRPVADASGRDPPATVSFHDLQATKSNREYPVPTEFPAWFPPRSCTRQAEFPLRHQTRSLPLATKFAT